MTGARLALILWDVDHTLIENGGVSKENYALAFELITGRLPAIQPRTDGRTDMAIMADLLTSNGESLDMHGQAEQFEMLAAAGEVNRTALQARGHALAGAEATLHRIADEPTLIQSVLTGNIEQNARIKLATFGLDEWLDFTVGAFGVESAVRSRLVAVAQRKAAERYGFDPGRDATVLVGDTELDVQAGLDGGARVLAVATGVSSMDELREAGADAVLADLADQDAVMAAIERLRALGPVPAKGQAAGS